MDDAWKFETVDLTGCDREPIHICGAIQPHGVLLAMDRRDFVIRQWAGDTLFFLGVELRRTSQLSLFSLFDEQALSPILVQLKSGKAKIGPSILLGLISRSGHLPLDATLRADGDTVIMELEAARGSPLMSGDALSLVKNMLAALQSVAGLEAFCQAAAEQVRASTGFDRVMIYRFLHDDSGEVIAEAKGAGVDAFLGLRFPASDIPNQARELYRHSWLRLIPDADYLPAPLEPASNGPNFPPLDMGLCALRSVSPIHLEYMRNMGVAASMSMSIVIGDRLWGLIACHSFAPHYVAADLRIACELFAQIFSLQLEAKTEAGRSERRISARHVREGLTARLTKPIEVGAELVTGEPTLLDMIPAGGVAVWLDDRLHTLGDVPAAEFIMDLAAWLHKTERSFVETSELGALLPAAASCAGVASGLLALSLSRQPKDYVLWFRPEAARTVLWAGEPNKLVASGPLGERLTPRKSFDVWRQEARGKSEPWDPIDIETAQAFRVWLLGNVLQQIALARKEDQATIARQAMLMAELDHRVKNILANTQALVQQSKGSAETIEGFALSLERRIRAMAQAHELTGTFGQGADLRSLIDAEIAPFRSEGNVSLSGEARALNASAALPVALVIHELTTNAAKYGALSTPEGKLAIDWRHEDDKLVVTWIERDGPKVVPPTRRGFGSVMITRGLVHDLGGSASLGFEPQGVSCILTLPVESLVAPSGEDGK
jgi:light-regulated signal transduction histidine kinase (bacteriophytochrome)